MAYESDQYGWKDLEVSLNGRNLADIIGFEFSEEIESELVYGKGNKPLAIQDGNIKYEGNLIVHKSELDRIINLTGNRGVAGLRNLTITSALVKDGGISLRTFVKVRITKLPEGWKQNDKFAEITCPFIFLDIIYG